MANNTIEETTEIFFRHWNHPVKRMIIELLIGNENRKYAVIDISHYLKMKLEGQNKYVRPGAQNQTNQFITTLKKAGIIARMPRNGVPVHWYTLPEFVRFIKLFNETFQDHPIFNNSNPVDHAACTNEVQPNENRKQEPRNLHAENGTGSSVYRASQRS